MDTDEIITAMRFYLRCVRRLSRNSDAPLSAAAEAALWEHSAIAASRLRRLAAAERVPVPVKRGPNQPRPRRWAP